MNSDAPMIIRFTPMKERPVPVKNCEKEKDWQDIVFLKQWELKKKQTVIKKIFISTISTKYIHNEHTERL